jgi:hypothetical protein
MRSQLRIVVISTWQNPVWPLRIVLRDQTHNPVSNGTGLRRLLLGARDVD